MRRYWMFFLHAAAPDIIQQLIVRDHETQMGRKHVQQPILFAGQFDLVVVQQHRPVDEVDRERDLRSPPDFRLSF